MCLDSGCSPRYGFVMYRRAGVRDVSERFITVIIHVDPLCGVALVASFWAWTGGADERLYGCAHRISHVRAANANAAVAG